MPLVNLTTNLKSLRYGSDRRDQGSSNQPYVTTPIPDGKGPGLGDVDFLLRGGSLLPASVVKDVSRLTQMMFDFKSPNGLLFSVKQNALSRSGVNIKAQGKSISIIGNPNRLPLNNGIYLPTSILAQAAVNPLGGHLLKQGINPFASTNDIANGNSLSTGFGGLLPLSNPIYLDTLAQNERQTNVKSSRLIQFLDNKILSNDGNQTNLYSYSGGPGSTLGVGKTNILISKDRTGINNPFLAGDATSTADFFSTEVGFGYYNYSVFNRPSVNFQGARIFNGNNVSALYEDLTGTNVLKDQYKTTNSNTGALREFSTNVFQTGSFQASSTVNGLKNTLDYNQLMEAGGSGSPRDSEINRDFRTISSGSSAISIDYTQQDQRLDGRVNQGSPGSKFASGSRTNYVVGRGEALDKINALQIYKSKTSNVKDDIKDLCTFRIGVIDNDNPNLKTYIHFRAFIDSMDDSYTADWSSQNFMGRAESLYNYQGFDRSINLSWTVAAQSKQELIPMYQKLNYLASVCAPDYSSNGYIRGNLIELTVGGYLHNQVGIMKGIQYSVPQDSPWEIGINNEDAGLDKSVKELPFIIKVSGFSFIPIHNFVPNVQKNIFAKDNTSGSSVEGDLDIFGPERYISLSNSEGNNYTPKLDENQNTTQIDT